MMGEFTDLQVYEHVAAEQSVVEHQIDKEMLLVEGEAFLPRLKEEAFAQFQEEVFQPINDGSLQIMLGVASSFFKAQEFQHTRVFDHVLRCGDKLALFRKFVNSFLITTQCKAFIIGGTLVLKQLRFEGPG